MVLVLRWELREVGEKDARTFVPLLKQLTEPGAARGSYCTPLLRTWRKGEGRERAAWALDAGPPSLAPPVARRVNGICTLEV